MQINKKGHGKIQQIVLTEKGEILKSDNILFSIEKIKNHFVRDYFPFIDSIFDTLLTMHPKDPDLLFECIATKHHFLPGYYDYHFSKKLINKEYFIIWTIIDRTVFYHSKREKQQEQVEGLLNKRKLQKRRK